jgi:hypothetical protein
MDKPMQSRCYDINGWCSGKDCILAGPHKDTWLSIITPRKPLADERLAELYQFNGERLFYNATINGL